MNKEFLARLFYTASAEHGQPCKGRRLNEFYEQTPEINAMWAAVGSNLASCGVDMDSVGELADLTEAYEQQGFINGFRLGMMLLDELNVSKLDTERRQRDD